MHVQVPLLVLLGSGYGGSVRIPLDLDLKRSPFLHSNTDNSLSKYGFVWGQAHLGRLLHLSHLVEVGPRGVLFVPFTDSTSPNLLPLHAVMTHCPPSASALCVLEEGSVLPSAVSQETIFQVGKPQHDPLLSYLAGARDSCQTEGSGWGRIYSAGANYTVMACDAVQGTHVLVYEPHGEHRLIVQRQTLGPMGYLVMLIAAIINIYALAQQKEMPLFARCNAALSALACAVLRIKGEMIFHKVEDEVLFWLSVVLALGYLAYGEQHKEGVLLSLSLMAASIYRTHETPYAPILGYVLGFYSWDKLFAGAQDHLVVLVFTSLFCEIALRPQSQNIGMWPITLASNIFITFCIAKYRDLSLWTPSP
jgi:hypothetical protein